MARTMKDSGIKRIGNIPEEWKVSRVKYIYSIIGSGTTPPSAQEEYYDNGEYFWIQSGDIYKTKYITETEKKITKLAVDKFNTLKLYPADFLVIAMYGASIGNVAISKINAMTNQACCAFIPNKNTCFNFIYYSLVNEKEIMLDMSVGGTQPNISQAKILELPILLPPLSEQQKIADYLDDKCSKIDEITAKIKSTIDECKKLKQSVITEAVTKGIRPNREMKDSGIEWIGEIPKEWEIRKIKHLFTNGKGLPITKENLIKIGLPVISYGQIHSKNNSGTEITDDLLRCVDFQYQNNFPQCEVFQYDFIFADTSEDYDGCGNCAYKQDSSILFGGYHTIILHSNYQKDNKYFAYLFKTDSWRKQLREVATGVKLFTIAQKTLMNSSLIIPSESEQQEIADYLDKKCAEIDKLIAKKEQLLTELENYKKSLIYEYVTGKKEVV